MLILLTPHSPTRRTSDLAAAEQADLDRARGAAEGGARNGRQVVRRGQFARGHRRPYQPRSPPFDILDAAIEQQVDRLGKAARGGERVGFGEPRARRDGLGRSEVRRVGTECGSQCRYRWSADHETKNRYNIHLKPDTPTKPTSNK